MTETYDRDRALFIMKSNDLFNTSPAFAEAENVGIPLPAACAVLEKETHGRNIYGNDAERDSASGKVTRWGMLSGYDQNVNEDNFLAFWFMVLKRGALSNGVGPMQITSVGLLQQMMDQNLLPWLPGHNMRFGFTLIWGYHNEAVAAGNSRPWVAAGRRYNNSLTYGEDLAKKIVAWRDLLKPALVP